MDGPGRLLRRYRSEQNSPGWYYERAFARWPPSTPPESHHRLVLRGRRLPTADQHLAGTFFAVRAAQPNPELPSVGSISSGPYTRLADEGFEGAEDHRRWLHTATGRRRSSIHPNATAASPGRSARGVGWPRPSPDRGERLRQAVRCFGPVAGAAPRAEGVAGSPGGGEGGSLHDFCIWLNGQLGRPRLAFADLLGW